MSADPAVGGDHEGSALPPFTWYRASGLTDALERLRHAGACAYAGGTDLMVALRGRAEWVADVRHLVDIKQVREARGIERQGETLRIGALTTARELASSELVRRHALALAMAASQTSSPWLRARGTIGGNVMTPHPAGDVTTALLALGASAEFAGSGRGRERIPLADLLAPDVAPSRRALLVALHVPRSARSWYERIARRQAFSRATFAVAVVEGVRGAQHPRVGVAGVAARPVLRTDAALAPWAAQLIDVLVERARSRAADGAGRG